MTTLRWADITSSDSGFSFSAARPPPAATSPEGWPPPPQTGAVIPPTTGMVLDGGRLPFLSTPRSSSSSSRGTQSNRKPNNSSSRRRSSTFCTRTSGGNPFDYSLDLDTSKSGGLNRYFQTATILGEKTHAMTTTKTRTSRFVSTTSPRDVPLVDPIISSKGERGGPSGIPSPNHPSSFTKPGLSFANLDRVKEEGHPTTIKRELQEEPPIGFQNILTGMAHPNLIYVPPHRRKPCSSFSSFSSSFSSSSFSSSSSSFSSSSSSSSSTSTTTNTTGLLETATTTTTGCFISTKGLIDEELHHTTFVTSLSSPYVGSTTSSPTTGIGDDAGGGIENLPLSPRSRPAKRTACGDVVNDEISSGLMLRVAVPDSNYSKSHAEDYQDSVTGEHFTVQPITATTTAAAAAALPFDAVTSQHVMHHDVVVCLPSTDKKNLLLTNSSFHTAVPTTTTTSSYQLLNPSKKSKRGAASTTTTTTTAGSSLLFRAVPRPSTAGGPSPSLAPPSPGFSGFVARQHGEGRGARAKNRRRRPNNTTAPASGALSHHPATGGGVPFSGGGRFFGTPQYILPVVSPTVQRVLPDGAIAAVAAATALTPTYLLAVSSTAPLVATSVLPASTVSLNPAVPVCRSTGPSPGTATPIYSTEEEERRRVEARCKDIAIGKATTGYRNYLARRTERGHNDDTYPGTPDPYDMKLPRAHFKSCLKVWREILHSYDDQE